MGFVLFRGKKAEFLTNASALTKGGLNPLHWRVLPPPTIFKDPLKMVQLMIWVRPTEVLLYFFFFKMYFFIFWLSQGLVAACGIFVVAHGLSCPSRDQSCVPYIAKRVLNYWIAKEVCCRLSLFGSFLLTYSCH